VLERITDKLWKRTICFGRSKYLFIATVLLLIAGCVEDKKEVENEALFSSQYEIKLSASKYQKKRDHLTKLNQSDINDAKKLNQNEPEILIDTYDLNNDGNQELFVYYQHKFFCGSHGCRFEIYEERGSDKLIRIFDVITHKTITTISGNGYADIHLTDRKNNQKNIWKWTGKNYVCSNCGEKNN